MTDSAATQRPPSGSVRSGAVSHTRRILPDRGLPGGRAVVGALLVAAAAVATFAIYLDGTAGPDTAYVVAHEPVAPGTRFDRFEDVTAAFGAVTVELAEPLRGRAVAVDELETLVGRTLLAPLQRGDLLTRTHLLDDAGAAPAQTLSFPVARTDAVAGALRPGERIDVVATYGSGDRAYTAYVVRGVLLLRLSGADGATVGGEVVGSQLTLTVAVTEPEDVQRLGHAVNTAQLLVTRSPATPGGRRAPGAYRPEETQPGPVPDPATGVHTEDRRTDDVGPRADGPEGER